MQKAAILHSREIFNCLGTSTRFLDFISELFNLDNSPNRLNSIFRLLHWKLISPKKQELTFAILIISFVIMMVQLVRPAEAAETSIISWKGSAAEDYVSTDDVNGLHSDLYIFASDSARKDSGTDSSSVAYINLYQYRQEKVCDVDETGQEQCSNQYVNVLAFDGFAILPNSQGFKTSGLSGATLKASISGFDSASGTTKSPTIDGVWSGIGQPSSENYVSNYHTADYVIHGRASGLHRSAQIEGSIEGDGISINLDPSSSSANEGSLQDSNAGYIEITK